MTNHGNSESFGPTQPENVHSESEMSPWREFARRWDLFTSPARPSQGDCAIYDRFIRGGLSDGMIVDALVLGSTPELRDLVGALTTERGGSVTCVDASPDMYQSMSLLTQTASANEEYREANWLALPFQAGSVDLVVGDFVTCNLTPEQQPQLLRQVSHVLRPSGVFVNREALMKPNCVVKSVESVLTVYADQFERGQLTLLEAATYTVDDLIRGSNTRRNDRSVSLAFYADEIERLASVLPIGSTSRTIYNQFLSAWWPMREKCWTLLTLEEEHKLLREFFDIEEIASATDYPQAPFSPIVRLEKKSEPSRFNLPN